MHKARVGFLAAIALVLFAARVAAGDDERSTGAQWRQWEPAVFEQAGRESKLVLLDLVAEWCAFCEKMDRTTWRDPEVVAAIDADYVPVRADPEKEKGLPGHFSDYPRPSTVILSADGSEILHKKGYLPPQWMLWTLQAVALEQGQGQ